MTDQQRPAWAVRLQDERDARGWSKFDTARRLLGAVGIAPAPQKVKTLARQILGWEKGDHFPRDWADAYASVYEIPRAELFPGGAEVLRGIVVESQQAGHSLQKEPYPSQLEAIDAMERRALLQLLTALGAGAALPVASAVPAEALETIRTGLDHAIGDGASLEDWEQAAFEHAHAIRVSAPAALIGVLAADITDIRHALDHRTDLDRARAHRVTAQMAALMAMALEELGNPLAARWWRTAHRAAAQSGDRHIQVYIHGRQARVTSALHHADEAVRIANATPSAGLAEAHASRAAILAKTGKQAAAKQALSDLDALYPTLPTDVTGESAAIWGWPQERYAGERTIVRLYLGDPSLYDELPRSPESTAGPRNQALGQLETAWARVNAGDVEAGLDDAANAINQLPKEHHTMTVRSVGGRVVSALPDTKARTLPAARELRALTT